MRTFLIVLVLLAGGCKKAGTSPVSSDIPSVAPPLALAPPAAAPPTSKEDLYASCRDRVENPQADGECKTDADCTKAGCGSEVCTTQAAAKELMTTCDARYCYQALDTCGCHEGTCTWTLKDPGPPPPPSRMPPM